MNSSDKKDNKNSKTKIHESIAKAIKLMKDLTSGNVTIEELI
jgi:hypothetical protein